MPTNLDAIVLRLATRWNCSYSAAVVRLVKERFLAIQADAERAEGERMRQSSLAPTSGPA